MKRADSSQLASSSRKRSDDKRSMHARRSAFRPGFLL